eukprot:161704-Chlamydomonas_euryale.AAC.3
MPGAVCEAGVGQVWGRCRGGQRGPERPDGHHPLTPSPLTFQSPSHFSHTFILQVTGDGNCFFRSLSDQMEGSEASHSALRANVMDHIRDHQDDFAPFVEDDEVCRGKGGQGGEADV